MPTRQAKEEFLGIAQWLTSILEKNGISRSNFASMAGLSTSTMTELLQAKASYNKAQVQAILRGLEQVGIRMTEEDWEEKKIACQPTQVYPTIRDFVRSWEKLPDDIRRGAALEISRKLLDDYATFTTQAPASVLIKQAEKRIGRTLEWICNEYGLPHIRMWYLRQGYNVKLSNAEVESFAAAILPAPRKNSESVDLEGLLMTNRQASPDMFIQLIDKNFELLNLSSIEDLAGLMTENKCSLSDDELLELLQQLYLEREPLRLDNQKHNQFLESLAVILVGPDGKPFGNVTQLESYCGISFNP